VAQRLHDKLKEYVVDTPTQQQASEFTSSLTALSDEAVLNQLRSMFPALNKLLDAENSADGKRTLTIAAHSLEVLKNWNEIASSYSVDDHHLGAFDSLPFSQAARVITLLHDIGKPVEGSAHQKLYSVPLMDHVLEALGFPSDARCMAHGVITDSSVSNTARRRLEPAEAALKMANVAQRCHMRLSDWFNIRSAFWMSDASSYTVLKGKFERDETGKLIPSESRGLSFKHWQTLGKLAEACSDRQHDLSTCLKEQSV